MVISQPPEGNNPSYYYRASPLPQLLWMFPETPMPYTCNYNIRVTYRNGAIHIFTRIRSTEGSSADCSLFILSLHALALHLCLYYYFKSFYEDLSTLPYIHLNGCISLQNASRTALCYATNTIMKTFLIFDINHQQNTRRSDQIETDKKHKCKLRAPRITWKVLNAVSVAIFKEIFDQVRKDLDCELFYSWTKNVTTSHIIFNNKATDNIHIVLENDNTVLIKGLKKVVMRVLKKHASYRNVLW